MSEVDQSWMGEELIAEMEGYLAFTNPEHAESYREGFRTALAVIEHPKMKQRLAEADLIINGISEPSWSDERVKYVDVQISREDYKALQDYKAKHKVEVKG